MHDDYLEMMYEDRHIIPDEDEYAGMLDYCDECGEHWTRCFCDEEDYEEG